ncbi:hypothetical protein EZS27_012584 [termite gut metagenome]|jgi:hypothetical protein|uniref:Uncharacterized protein n=1 Tax=termite gut metagenome TaxID=433724 RepID=A0A5J4S216_9ZZZZ
MVKIDFLDTFVRLNNGYPSFLYETNFEEQKTRYLMINQHLEW